jgi:hypothetical protein
MKVRYLIYLALCFASFSSCSKDREPVVQERLYAVINSSIKTYDCDCVVRIYEAGRTITIGQRDLKSGLNITAARGSTGDWECTAKKPQQLIRLQVTKYIEGGYTALVDQEFFLESPGEKRSGSFTVE